MLDIVDQTKLYKAFEYVDRNSRVLCNEYWRAAPYLTARQFRYLMHLLGERKIRHAEQIIEKYFYTEKINDLCPIDQTPMLLHKRTIDYLDGTKHLKFIFTRCPKCGSEIDKNNGHTNT